MYQELLNNPPDIPQKVFKMPVMNKIGLTIHIFSASQRQYDQHLYDFTPLCDIFKGKNLGYVYDS